MGCLSRGETLGVARREAIMLAVRSEGAFGKSGLPRRDWGLFKRPLVSLLASSLHRMDSKLRAQGKTEEMQKLLTLPSTRPDTTHQA